MKFLIIAFLVFFNFNKTEDLHDSVTATFNVIEKGHVIMLEIDFDTHDYLKINSSENQTITKKNFNAYLNNTTSWEFDGENLVPNVLSIKPSGHHTKVVCLLSESKKNFKSIKIKNEFLLSIKSHSNVVMLDLNGVYKDYRLHKNRKVIQVSYN